MGFYLNKHTNNFSSNMFFKVMMIIVFLLASFLSHATSTYNIDDFHGANWIIRVFDGNKDGKITKNEVTEVVTRTLDPGQSKSDCIDMMMMMYDTNNDNVICMIEFASNLLKYINDENDIYIGI